jgi:hypothetical protein
MADWSQLGTALGGSVNDAQGQSISFLKGQNLGMQNQHLGAETQAALAQAEERVNKQKALKTLAPMMSKIPGITPEMADAAATTLAAGGNVMDMFNAAAKSQEVGFRNAAAAAPTPAGANRQLLNLANGPVDLNQSMGEGTYTDRFDPTQAVHTNELGDALVGQRNASADLDRERAAHPENFRAPVAPPLDPATIAALGALAAKGQIGLPTGRALTTPTGAGIVQAAAGINPNLDQATFPNRQAAIKSFKGGGVDGRQVGFISTALTHLDTTDKLAQALNNGDFQVVNRLMNALGAQTGSPAPTSLQGAGIIVGNEVVKAIASTGNLSKDERMKIEAAFSDVRSPSQLADLTNTYRELLAGQLGTKARMYKATTGLEDFNTLLSPASIALLKKAQATEAAATAGPGGEKEGDTGVSKSGKPTVYRGGHWEYQ